MRRSIVLCLTFLICMPFVCSVPCLENCKSKACLEECGYEGEAIGMIPGFEFRVGSQKAILQDINESEIQWIQHILRCDLNNFIKCNSNNLHCNIDPFCKQLVFSEDHTVTDLGNTECIEQCTDFCKANSPDRLDECLGPCLKNLC